MLVNRQQEIIATHWRCEDSRNWQQSQGVTRISAIKSGDSESEKNAIDDLIYDR